MNRSNHRATESSGKHIELPSLVRWRLGAAPRNNIVRLIARFGMAAPEALKGEDRPFEGIGFGDTRSNTHNQGPSKKTYLGWCETCLYSRLAHAVSQLSNNESCWEIA